MSKETRKAKDQRELQALTANVLTVEQLRVIRKLNGATFLPGNSNVSKSRRTIEAVLQGRRQDVRILQAAIENAKAELRRFNSVMGEVDGLLCSDITTKSGS